MRKNINMKKVVRTEFQGIYMINMFDFICHNLVNLKTSGHLFIDPRHTNDYFSVFLDKALCFVCALIESQYISKMTMFYFICNNL